jgi:hypothetical protein
MTTRYGVLECHHFVTTTTRYGVFDCTPINGVLSLHEIDRQNAGWGLSGKMEAPERITVRTMHIDTRGMF